MNSDIIDYETSSIQEKEINTVYRIVFTSSSFLELKCFQLQRSLRKTMKIILTDGRIVRGRLQVAIFFLPYIVFRFCLEFDVH